MRRTWVIVAGLLLVLIAFGAWHYLRSSRLAAADSGISEQAATQMEQKLAVILENAAKPSGPTTVYLSEQEVNSYFRYRMGAKIPVGVSDVTLDFRPDRPSGTAIVDFDQVKAASKKRVNAVLDYLLSGRKPVAVTGHFTSSAGQGLFHLEEVSIGGFTLRGALLDTVIRHFVVPRYPNVAIDRPFQLPANIEQIAVEEGRVRVRQK